MCDRIAPSVKWAGGKSQLIDKLIELMPKKYNMYFEPFIGGGALFFAIKPKKAVINDINSNLLNVYNQLQKNAKRVIEKLNTMDKIKCDKKHYLAMRERFNEKILNKEHDIEFAALFIWINKHCFNGIYRENSKGLFNVPYNNKETGSSFSYDNLMNINEFLKSCDLTILNVDFEEACKSVKKNDFVYFDSPYVPINKTAYFTGYTKEGFSYDDHCRLARLFKKLDKKGAKIMLSNHNVKLVYELYEGYNIEAINVRRAINSVATKRTGKEVIITNY